MTDVMKSVRSVAAMTELMHGADYMDVKTFIGKRTLHEYVLRLVTYEPAWLRGLYRIRSGVAKLLGLTHDEEAFARSKDQGIDMTPGGMVSAFMSTASKPDHYWIGEVRDKHLDCFIAVVTEPDENGRTRFHTVTVVHYRHWIGPVYFNLIRPFHHVVVNYMGRYAAAD
jgi:hypothetical protein